MVTRNTRDSTPQQVDPIRQVEDIQPAVAYLYEEEFANPRKSRTDDDIFVFQYWPESVQVNYTPNYNQVTIPGGSHPLYQYVSGGERQISFQATFTSEVKDFGRTVEGLNHGAKYTVDVAAAMARLERYLYPKYRTGGQLGVTLAPPRLVLVLPKTNLGRDEDQVLVILRSAPVTYIHWFPDGTPRAAQVDLEFSESVQSEQEGNRTRVNFIGSDRYDRVAKRYRLTAKAIPNFTGR